MLAADFQIFCLYVGIEAATRNTGDYVYSFNESIVSKHLKLGAALQYDFGNSSKYTSSKIILCPYVGFGSWNVRDSSGNDIGAHTSYGDREKFTSFGVKAMYRHHDFPLSVGIDFSTHTVGLSVGVAF